MKSPLHRLRLEIEELEGAFDHLALAGADSMFDAGSCFSFLDLVSGGVVSVESEDEAEALAGDEDHIELPEMLFEDLSCSAREEFVASLSDHPLRAELERALRGKGASRRFENIVFGGGDIELRHDWQWFETKRKRERVVGWLREQNIEPDWGRDIFEPPPLPEKRADLLRAVLDFVRGARALAGVRRIGLLGSLTTAKAVPKDVDLLVEVGDDTPLDKLARLKRQLLGKTLQTGDGCGADVFLCDPKGEYLGRICPWKQCVPGIRSSCKAQHCGRREFLYDDLQNIRLDPLLLAEPPLELWPEVVARVEVPDDVREVLVGPSKAASPTASESPHPPEGG